MRWAYAFGLCLAFLLPKRVECGVPETRCARRSSLGLLCTAYEVEPWGFYAIEKLAGKNVGFAYSHDEDCH
jgi:hypothetical protein